MHHGSGGGEAEGAPVGVCQCIIPTSQGRALRLAVQIRRPMRAANVQHGRLYAVGVRPLGPGFERAVLVPTT